MMLLIIAVLAICGLFVTTGLLWFYLLILIRKEKQLLFTIGVSILGSVSTLIVGSYLPLKSIISQPEKHYMFYSILANYILILWFLVYLKKNKTTYFPANDSALKKSNKIALIIYFTVAAVCTNNNQ
jgi:hypothetical protein